jgi:aryl-alcohol dehydrogenase-like predicted oxidoreductase
MGSVQLGLSYGAANRTGKPAREAALRLVQRAADSGIAGFDTARAYGDSEERLGDGLVGRRVPTVTKLSPLNGLPSSATEKDVFGAVDASIRESLAALKQRELDCVLLHRASHLSDYDGAIWRRLKDHFREGRIAKLGVSVQSPVEALKALSDPAVEHIQLPFNLLDWRWQAGGVVQAIRLKPSLTIHVRSVFLQGLLAAGDPGLWPNIAGVDPNAVVTWLTGLVATLRRENAADVCLAYVRAQNWIDGVVIGMENESQLDSNLRICACPPLNADQCVVVETSRPRVPAQLLDPAQWPRT